MKQFYLLTGIFLFITTFSYSQTWSGDYTTTTGSIYRTGNMAIGVNGASSHPFLVSHPGISLTSSGTNYLISGVFQLLNSYNIPSGVTENGYRMGVDINAYVNTANFTGTLNKQFGMRIQYGAYTSSGPGIINTSIGLYLNGLESGSTTIKDSYGIYQSSSGSKNYFAGNIGIGTISPSKKLTIYSGDLLFTGNNNNILAVNGDNTSNTPMLFIGEQQRYGIGFKWDNAISLDIVQFDNQDIFGTESTKLGYFRIRDKSFYWSGKVGIGTTAPTAKLTVKGDILASKVEIKNDSEIPASDYVFDQGYNLRSLPEVEQFVKANKHLPEVPSAEEFKENGYSVGEMDDILLRKVEELTLYVIELKKENKAMSDRLELLEKE